VLTPHASTWTLLKAMLSDFLSSFPVNSIGYFNEFIFIHMRGVHAYGIFAQVFRKTGCTHQHGSNCSFQHWVSEISCGTTNIWANGPLSQQRTKRSGHYAPPPPIRLNKTNAFGGGRGTNNLLITEVVKVDILIWL